MNTEKQQKVFISRIANQPLILSDKVTVTVGEDAIAMKGPMGALSVRLPAGIACVQSETDLSFSAKNSSSRKEVALSGTIRALVANMHTGVSIGFEKRLKLVGVGYRAALSGKQLNLSLGFSHPVNFDIPAAVTIEVPSQTEVVVRGVDKQAVGQVAADIRFFRPPEPYKGKGVRYADEVVRRKEVKKK